MLWVWSKAIYGESRGLFGQGDGDKVTERVSGNNINGEGLDIGVHL